MKKLISLLLALVLSLSLSFALATEETPLRVGALKGPTSMGLVKLMKDKEGTGEYAFTLAASPDALLPELVRGGLDIACLPVNLAAILFANTKGAIQVVNINTLGVLYIIEKGETVNNLSGLAGKTLYASGKSSTPEYVLNHLLNLAKVEGVDIQWKGEHQEVLAALMADPTALALLPQPFVAVAQLKSPDIRIAVDLNQEWANLGEGSLITGVTVARAELIKEQPEKLENFLKDYESSVSFVYNNHEEAAKLIGEFDIINEKAALLALPYAGITFVKGGEMVAQLTPFYQMLFDSNPATTGGSLPTDAFYYAP